MDKNRRTFLKILLIGGGTLLVGKVFGPILLKLLDKSGTTSKLVTAQADPKDFRIVEHKERLSIYDNSGEEVFQIDYEA